MRRSDEPTTGRLLARLLGWGALSGFLTAMSLIFLLGSRWQSLYSIGDAGSTLVYLGLSLCLLHDGLMLALGLPIFLGASRMPGSSRRQAGRLAEMVGLLTVLAYHLLLPPLKFLLRSSLDPTSALRQVLLVRVSLFLGLAIGIWFILRRWDRSGVRIDGWLRLGGVLVPVLALAGLPAIQWYLPDLHRFPAHLSRPTGPEESIPAEPIPAPQPSEETRPRNVLLVSYDALRSDHLSFFGYPRQTSPFLDTILAGAASFANGTAPYPKTSPSVASILTGTYPWKHGVWQTGCLLPDKAVSLAEELRQRGFTTKAVVANPNLSPTFGFDQGFQEYHPLGDAGPDLVTDTALSVVAGGASSPFLLWVHYLDPHGPYDPPQPFTDRFQGDATYQQDLAPDRYLPPLATDRGDRPTAESVADALMRYDGEILRQDAELKRLIQGLTDAGWMDRTLLIFTSDHGEFFGHHGYYFDHGPSPYREMQVPLAWHYPDLIPPQRLDRPVELQDLAPTTLGLLGLSPRSMEIQGVDLSPALLRPGSELPSRRDALGTSYTTNSRGTPQFFLLRTDRWHLVVNRLDSLKRPRSLRDLLTLSDQLFEFQGRGVELYDRVKDPLERENLAIQKPEVTSVLLRRLAERLNQVETHQPGEVEAIPRQELDPAMREELESLGYLD